jgi:rhodanese-related sulfurtransferase
MTAPPAPPEPWWRRISPLRALRRALGGANTITAMEARKLLQERPGVVVLDVRQAGEFRGGHIPGAKHMPVGLASARADKLDPEATYLVYCRSGARSSRAASALSRRGLKHVYNLHGGILAWQSLGFPVKRK